MATQDYDVTEKLPFPISNPLSATNYTLSGVNYDVAFGTKPFFMAISDEFPYRRQTAPYRKQQIDQSNEPGEQSLTSWWLRSQSSFHKGAGITYFDPSAGETVAYRFTESRGVDIWTKGKVTLLKDVDEVHYTTGQNRSNGRPSQYIRSIRYGTTDAVLLCDDYDVDKITPAGEVHFIDYNAGTDDPVYAICDDGTYAYWVTNDTVSGKLEVNKKILTGDSTTPDTVMFTQPGITVTNAVMEYVKERLVMCVNNKVYEFSTSASALPTEVYAHPNTNYVYTSITASGPAIYIAGYNGIKSVIHKFTLSTAGAMPTLTSAITAAEMPEGEIIYRIFYYLGFMMIGTSKGIRAAVVSDQDGSINYGPLILETSQPVYDFAARDKYIWCATNVGNNPGTTRINLGEEIETLRFAYSNDIYEYDTQDAYHQTTGVSLLGNSSRIVFCTNALSSATADRGGIYIESETNLIPSGYLQTGFIRYATAEDKVFKLLKPRLDNTYGGLIVESVAKDGQDFVIAHFDAGDTVQEAAINYPAGVHEYLGFRFTLDRVTSTTTSGPVFTGYQLKALPAIARQRLIQFPVFIYDLEEDPQGNKVGYEGSAYDRLKELEAIEATGDTIRVTDFRTGEAFIALIEEITFIGRTPTDKRFSGFGGIANITMRTVA